VIPPTDGSKAKALFAQMHEKEAAPLRKALLAAISRATTLTAQAAILGAPSHDTAIAKTVNEFGPAIGWGALDAAAEAFAACVAGDRGPTADE
jgi:hypothetical protein